MDPLSKSQMHGENGPDGENQLATGNDSLADIFVPGTLENGGQNSTNLLARPVTKEHIEMDKYIATRDPFSMPLVIIKADGTSGVLWAILDTGASYNFITLSLVRKLDLFDNIQRKVPEIEITTGDGITTTMTHCLYLTFHARDDLRCYADVEFLVEQEDRVEDTERMDHTPHLFMGLPWLKDNHVFMLDEKFATTRFDDLEAIEPKPSQVDGFYFGSTRTAVPSMYVSRGAENLRPQKSSVPFPRQR